MTQAQVVAMVESWQQWEGRIVNGKFPLRQYLGGSEQSAVYLTEMEGARAVIKLIPAADPRAQIAGWKMAGRFPHPNLVRIFETGLWHADDQQDMSFAVMEYCEESLAAVLRQRPLTPGEAREMLGPTLEALSYLHAQSVVHGELKPTNILAAGDQLKLSCDGLRRVGERGELAAPGPYDAPERTKGVISLSGDIWSLGMTLVEALTDRLPVRDTSGKLGSTETLPAPFDAITKGCLAIDPQRRPSIAAIRNLLDPAAQAKADVKEAKIPQAKAEPRPQSVQPQAPVVNSNPSRTAARVENMKPAAAADNRRLVWIAAVVLLIVVIAVGMRLAHHGPEASQPTVSSVAPAKNVTEPPVVTPPRAVAARNSTAPFTSGAVAHEVMPEVSSPARKSINGTVKVSVRVAVDSQGKVSRAALASAGPSKYFASQALQAARQWTFVAPVHDGKPQASAWTLLFEFKRSGTKSSARHTPTA